MKTNFMSRTLFFTVAVLAAVMWGRAVFALPTIAFTVGLTSGTGPKNLSLAETYTLPTLYVANSATTSITVIPMGGAGYDLQLNGGVSDPWGVAAYDNPTNPRVYVTNKVHSTVSVLDASVTPNIEITGAGFPIGVTAGPMGIAANKNTNKIYVANNIAGNVTVINGNTALISSVIPGFTNPLGVAVNSTTNRIFVSNNGSTTVRVIDGAGDTLRTNIGVAGDIRGLCVDETQNLIFAVSGGGKRVYVINGATEAVIGSFAVPQTPDSCDVAPQAGLIYITSSSSGNTYVNKATSPYSAVVGSPLVTGTGTYGIVTPKAPGPEPWNIFAAVTNTDSVKVIQETDSYPPNFAGLTSAADGGTSIAAGGPTMILNWSQATDASTPVTYHVYLSRTPGGENYATSPFYSTTSYGVVPLQGGLMYATNYYVVVRASDSSVLGNSDSNTIEKSVKLTDGAAPAGGGVLLSAVNTGIGGQVILSWNPAVDDSPPITYNVYMGYSTASMPLYYSTTTATGITLNGLTNGTLHYFMVRAKDAAGLESNNVAIFSTMPTDITPPVFTGLVGAANAAVGGTVNLSWNPATDVSGPITYVGYLQAGSTVSYSTPAFTTTQTNYNVQGLTNGTGYAFAVRARDFYGNSDSNVAVLTATPTDTMPPNFGGVSSVSDMASNGVLRLFWSAGTDNSPPLKYYVYMATATGAENFASYDYTLTASTSLVIYGLTNGTRYFFVVRSEDSAVPPNRESNTTELSAVPSDGAAPVFSGLDTATPTGVSGTIHLTWTAATDTSPPITYSIYRSTTSGGQNFSIPDYLAVATTTYDATGMFDGTKYYFIVRSSDAAGLQENNMVERSAIPNDGVPPAFAGISTLTDSKVSGTVIATWAAAADPAMPITYEVYTATASGAQNFATTPALITSLTTATITYLPNNIPIYVVVRARDAGGVIDTNVVQSFVTPTDQVKPAFSGLNGTVNTGNGGEVRLNWNDAADLSQPITYLIYQRIPPAAFDYSTPTYTTQFHPYLVSGLTDGVGYAFSVGAQDAASPTANVATSSYQEYATPTDTLPPTFSGLTSAIDALTSGAIDLVWNPATDRSGITQYNIYYATNPANFWTTPATTTASTTTQIQITGLKNSYFYYVGVRAVDAAAGLNIDTNEVRKTVVPSDTIAPAFAGIASATDTTLGGQVALTWATATDPSTPITYDIYYAVGASPSFSTPFATTQNSTGVVVTGLTNGLLYNFVVRAVDTYGNRSTNTNEFSALPTDLYYPTFDGAAAATDTRVGGEVRISWATATDFSLPITYDVYEATASGAQVFSTPSYSTTTLTSLTIPGLVDGNTYYYVVRARDAAGNQESNAVQVSAAPSDRTAPAFSGLQSAVTALEGNTAVLTWATATDRTPPIRYDVYMTNFPGTENYSSPSYTFFGTTTARITSLTDKTWYYFVMRASDSAAIPNEDTNTVEKAVLPTDTLGPAAPTDVSATPGDLTPTIGDEYVTITWTPPTTNMDGSPLTDLVGYNVYRTAAEGQNPGTPQNRLDGLDNNGNGLIDGNDTSGDYIPATATSYVDTTGIVSGTKYYYLVTALDDANPRNQSPYSNKATATPKNADTAVPSPPFSLTATPGDSLVTLRWTAPITNSNGTPLTDLQGYKVYRSTTSGVNYSLISTSTVVLTRYDDHAVTNATTYYYVVTAFDTSVPPLESIFSDQVWTTPSAQGLLAPSPPTALVITSASGTANLSWRAPTTNTDGSPMSDLAGYNVYRSTNPTAVFTKMNTTIVSQPLYQDTGLANGTTLYYYVTAVDVSNNESASSPMSFALYGAKGIQGVIQTRNSTGGIVQETGYPLSGIQGITVQLIDATDNVLVSGYTDGDGNYKIAYETALPTAVYKARAVITEASGYMIDSGDFIAGIGYKMIRDSISITTGFTTLPAMAFSKGPASGDSNCDGFVDSDDFLLLRGAYSFSQGDTNYKANADFNGDGTIDSSDFLILRQNYGGKATTLPPASLCTP